MILIVYKSNYGSTLILLKFLLFEMKDIIDGGCLFDNWYFTNFIFMIDT